MTRSEDNSPDPALVPWPDSISLYSGHLAWRPGARVVVDREESLPLARALAAELGTLAGHTPSVYQGPARPGDVALQLDADLSRRFEHQLEIADTVMLSARDARGLAHASATLLQLFDAEASEPGWPMGRVRDIPRSAHRALMIDVARRPHTIAELEQLVTLAWTYKLDFIQLHLTDNEGWTFPSTAYPALGTRNSGAVPRYELDELKALVEYADARGVTLVPEIDWPGHAGAMLRARGDLFDPQGTGNVNVATAEVWTALEEIVAEVCEVFASSPYFHIGGDEVSGFDRVLEQYRDDPWVTSRGVSDAHQLFTAFLVRMVEVVEGNGKRAMAWEFDQEVWRGAAAGGQAPPELRRIVMVPWENKGYPLPDLLAAGHDVINAPFCPLYLIENQTDVTPHYLYTQWDVNTYGRYETVPRSIGRCVMSRVEPHERLLGAMLCSWENRGAFELPGLRPLVGAYAERLWNPGAGARGYDDFEWRAHCADRRLAKRLGLEEEAEEPPSAPLPALEVTAYEPFDARFYQELRGLDGGSGFEGGWRVLSRNGPACATPGGLTYPGLQTSGGALTLEAEAAEPGIMLGRTLASGLGEASERVWVSFLLRADGAVPEGRALVRLGSPPTGVGKCQGRAVGIAGSGRLGELEPDRTYLFVASYDLGPDVDEVCLWVDPPLGREPLRSDGSRAARTEFGRSRELVIDVEGHGPAGADGAFASWTIDELRVAGTWQDVIPLAIDAEVVPASPARPVLTRSAGGVRLDWSAVEGAEGYHILRGLSRDLARSRVVGTTTKASFLDTGASAGAPYHYHVVALRAGGVSAPSERVKAPATAGSGPVAGQSLTGVFDLADAMLGGDGGLPGSGRFGPVELLPQRGSFTPGKEPDSVLAGVFAPGAGAATTISPEGHSFEFPTIEPVAAGARPASCPPGAAEHGGSAAGACSVLELPAGTGVTFDLDVVRSRFEGRARINSFSTTIGTSSRDVAWWLLIDGVESDSGVFTEAGEQPVGLDLPPVARFLSLAVSAAPEDSPAGVQAWCMDPFLQLSGDRSDVAPLPRSPADGAVGFPMWAPLTWQRLLGLDAVEVRLWKAGRPEPFAPTDRVSSTRWFPLELLEPETEYEWRISAPLGERRTHGVVASFTTQAAGEQEAPPFDTSAKARELRAELYEVDGIARLTGAETPLRQGHRIAFYGDSITDNTQYQRSLVSALASAEATRDLGLVTLNRGINGGKARCLLEGRRRWNAGGGPADPQPFVDQLEADQPDIAVIWIGVNEPNDYPATEELPASPPTSDEDYLDALSALVVAAKSSGARVVLATPALNGERPDGKNPLDGRLEELSAIVRAVADLHGVTLVDLRRACMAYLANHNIEIDDEGGFTFPATKGLLTVDGVHPNPRGCELAAELVADGIVRALSR